MDSLNLSASQSEEDKTGFVLWGCELNMERTSCTFKVKEDFLEHLFYLRTIFLGSEAKDELHVVAVESTSTYHGNPVPIASLRTSVLPMINVNGLELSPPVTFILKSGTGPVYICAQHLTLEDLKQSDLNADDSYSIELDRGDLSSPDGCSSYLANGIFAGVVKTAELRVMVLDETLSTYVNRTRALRIIILEANEQTLETFAQYLKNTGCPFSQLINAQVPFALTMFTFSKKY